mmetsp:Transcript_21264/g.67747  ORF Transcript_21264/g.67747 Transcript_21264/m.67747 type:complete len:244 (-) Transcript_21264:317-1048(-)
MVLDGTPTDSVSLPRQIKTRLAQLENVATRYNDRLFVDWNLELREKERELCDKHRSEAKPAAEDAARARSEQRRAARLRICQARSMAEAPSAAALETHGFQLDEPPLVLEPRPGRVAALERATAALRSYRVSSNAPLDQSQERCPRAVRDKQDHARAEKGTTCSQRFSTVLGKRPGRGKKPRQTAAEACQSGRACARAMTTMARSRHAPLRPEHQRQCLRWCHGRHLREHGAPWRGLRAKAGQ